MWKRVSVFSLVLLISLTLSSCSLFESEEACVNEASKTFVALNNYFYVQKNNINKWTVNLVEGDEVTIRLIDTPSTDFEFLILDSDNYQKYLAQEYFVGETMIIADDYPTIMTYEINTTGTYNIIADYTNYGSVLSSPGLLITPTSIYVGVQIYYERIENVCETNK